MSFNSPEHICLADLFRKRLFEIPTYQRTYSWKSKHREELFEDIERSFQEENKTHFMNVVIGFKRDTRQIIADKHSIIEIVDGQQRITTLVLIYKAISKALSGARKKEEKMLKDNIDEMLVKPTKDQLLLLQTNHDTSSYFTDYIRRGTIPKQLSVKTIADANLRNAMIECERFVQEWNQNKHDLVHLTAHLNNNVTFIYDEISQESLAYSVFEVLNSRGMPVSPLDLLKTLLMGKTFKQKCGEQTLEEIRTHWSEIYLSLNSANSPQRINSEILRFTGSLHKYHNGKLLNDKKSIETLIVMTDKCKDIVMVASMINNVTKILNSIYKDRHKMAVTKSVQARFVSTAIYLREDISEETKAVILRRLNNLTLRIHCLYRKEAKTETGSYVRLAYEIYKNEIPVNTILEEIEKIERKYPFNDDKINDLVKVDWYQKYNPEILYILFKYEEYIAKSKGLVISDDSWNRIWEVRLPRTIEHVSPQSKNKSYAHWLGNLSILPPGENSRLRDHDPADKVDAYNRSGLFISKDIVEHLSNWDEDAVKKRGRKILTWLQSEICTDVQSSESIT